jgi:hypothetical protein
VSTKSSNRTVPWVNASLIGVNRQTLLAVDTNILAACCRDNASFNLEGDEGQSYEP